MFANIVDCGDAFGLLCFFVNIVTKMPFKGIASSGNRSRLQIDFQRHHRCIQMGSIFLVPHMKRQSFIHITVYVDACMDVAHRSCKTASHTTLCLAMKHCTAIQVTSQIMKSKHCRECWTSITC